MFRNNPASEPAPVVTVPADDLVPLRHLSLEVDEPVGGWTAYLTGRGLEVLTDDIGRKAISRADARQLLDEQREAELRQREIAVRAAGRWLRTFSIAATRWFFIPLRMTQREPLRNGTGSAAARDAVSPPAIFFHRREARDRTSLRIRTFWANHDQFARCCSP
jgi:hypothetical protein